ncbi:MAG TPA: MurR/RpiR family transcriptional regulator [Afifellaceae bacterium]|nr:MurR/RpiR family transcriptional regulator [Afifellaceae bacterium]
MTAGGSNIAERVRDSVAQLTASEKRAAQTLLANYPVQGLETVARFAANAGVSAPTILRFINRIGFSGYADFQRALKEEVEEQLQSPLAKTAHVPAGRNGGGAPHEIFARAVAENVTETFSHLPAAEIGAVVDLLADPRRPAHVLGGRFTDALARYLTAHLRILRPAVTHMDGQPVNWRDQLIDMGRRDVLVIFDIRRYQQNLAELAEAAAKRHVTVVLLTDQWLSPVAGHARHVLPARITVPSPWDSSAALMVIVEALVAGVTSRRLEESRKRMTDLERLRDHGLID